MSRGQWAMALGLGVLVAPWVLRDAPLLLVPVAAFLVTYRTVRRRRRGVVVRRVPQWRQEVAQRTEWWGYVIPWDTPEGEPLQPAYVGITSRRPVSGGGRVWCDRWDDEDHLEKAAAYALDYSRAWVAFLEGATSEELAEQGWEYPLVRQYRRQGFSILNKLPYD